MLERTNVSISTHIDNNGFDVTTFEDWLAEIHVTAVKKDLRWETRSG
jgi:hypothetical protein